MNSTHEIPGGPDVAPFSNTRADCGDNFHLGRIIQRGYKFGGFDFKYGTIASRIVFVQERGVEICGLTRGERKCGVIRRQLGNQSISQRLRCLPWSGSALDTNGLPVEWDTLVDHLGDVETATDVRAMEPRSTIKEGNTSATSWKMKG